MAGNGIGAASRQSGCTIETIRYYERIGLIPKPPRNASRYRIYGAADVRRLVFVRRARELGFTLDEIRYLLRLAAGVADPCAAVHEVAVGHLRDVRAKIADLRHMERLLAKVVRQCERGEQAGCPMIDALSSDLGAVSDRRRDRASGAQRRPPPRRRAAQR